MKLITLLWPNGEITTGHTWREIEDAVRAAQWQMYPTRLDFRDEMVMRAEVWSGIMVKHGKTSEEFINNLSDAHMFMIVEEDV